MTDRYDELRAAAEAATPGPWEWWSSCSHWRLSAGGKDGAVISAFKASDGFPCVSVMEENRTYLALANPETIQALLSDLDAERALTERLRREAEQWSMEARAHESSLHKAYQIVTGGKGEPGNWNGAEPIRKAFDAITSERESLLAAVRDYHFALDIRTHGVVAADRLVKAVEGVFGDWVQGAEKARRATLTTKEG